MPETNRYLNIPCTITIEVEVDFDMDDEEALFNAVVEQHGKYPELDARHLGYEMVEEA